MGGSSLAISSVAEPGTVLPRNAHQWRAVADFLDAQWLASLGLRRVARKGPASGMGPREALPIGKSATRSLFLTITQ